MTGNVELFVAHASVLFGLITILLYYYFSSLCLCAFASRVKNMLHGQAGGQTSCLPTTANDISLPLTTSPLTPNLLSLRLYSLASLC